MKSDSYSRFIRSSAYQELLQAKKKVTAQGSPDVVLGADVCWPAPPCLLGHADELLPTQLPGRCVYFCYQDEVFVPWGREPF